MSKKGKRKKGNVHSSSPPRRTTAPPPVVAPSAPVPSASSVSAGISAGVLPGGGALPGPARAPSHGDLLVGQAVAEAAAEVIAPEPQSAELPQSRDDEESGPRMVAHAPPKAQSDFHHEDKVIVDGPSSSSPPQRAADADETSAARDEEAVEPEAAPVARPSRAPKGTKARAASAKAHSEPPKSSSPPPKAERRDSAAPGGALLEHESFFAEGEEADRAHREARVRGVDLDAHDREDEHDHKALAKMTPAVRERRARFTKYVKWTVGALSAVFLAGLIRVAVARGQHDAEPAPVAVAAQLQPLAPAAIAPTAPPAAPTQTAPEPAPSPVATAPAAPSPAATDTAATAPTNAAPSAAPAADTAAPPSDEVQPDPAAALQEKKNAQKALDRGDLKGAIEAGERSVALDPTDGDAWLLLGAAYQEKGKGADARRAFSSCVKQGKRGAVRECTAMLR